MIPSIAARSSTTVTDDGAIDTLLGGLDLDWFWLFGGDTSDASGETVN